MAGGPSFQCPRGQTARQRTRVRAWHRDRQWADGTLPPKSPTSNSGSRAAATSTPRACRVVKCSGTRRVGICKLQAPLGDGNLTTAAVSSSLLNSAAATTAAEQAEGVFDYLINPASSECSWFGAHAREAGLRQQVPIPRWWQNGALRRESARLAALTDYFQRNMLIICRKESLNVASCCAPATPKTSHHGF
jgi:hypothetical protein